MVEHLIQGRYENLSKSNNAICSVNNGNAESFANPYIDKDLDAALDSFDNLFCRRCLVSITYNLFHFLFSGGS